MTIPPVIRTILVSWSQEEAFRRFALDFATWWPRRTHSIGGERVRRIVLEPRTGGCIFEEHLDGRRFQWGRVLEWEPPARLRFTFHPSRDPATAQDVEVRFLPEGTGTRLELVASNWENWGQGAARARRGYQLGWGYVLKVWAGQRDAGMLLLDLLAAVLTAAQALRGGRAAAIAKAGGEIPPGRDAA